MSSTTTALLLPTSKLPGLSTLRILLAISDFTSSATRPEHSESTTASGVRYHGWRLSTFRATAQSEVYTCSSRRYNICQSTLLATLRIISRPITRIGCDVCDGGHQCSLIETIIMQHFKQKRAVLMSVVASHVNINLLDHTGNVICNSVLCTKSNL